MFTRNSFTASKGGEKKTRKTEETFLCLLSTLQFVSMVTDCDCDCPLEMVYWFFVLRYNLIILAALQDCCHEHRV